MAIMIFHTRALSILNRKFGHTSSNRIIKKKKNIDEFKGHWFRFISQVDKCAFLLGISHIDHSEK